MEVISEEDVTYVRKLIFDFFWNEDRNPVFRREGEGPLMSGTKSSRIVSTWSVNAFQTDSSESTTEET